ncbi:hypothetical protein LNJ08_05305 [Tenacibaculum finnmarkense genomovar ulcerans]|uniref:hypothetical protein n=1 Tax=Tenacibaculum finnmarkense TaxID=2781243 RepID=UPI001E5B763F|nr:hypothetical protein [Tenacibaculum finnmarkense]MCD8453803.1 hypothetical protein [Tenacibaculum finnmarkense genomovar ulcerans]
MNHYSTYRQPDVIIYILIGILILIIIRNWYNRSKKRSFREENEIINEQLNIYQTRLISYEEKIERGKKLQEKLKEKQQVIFELEQRFIKEKQQFKTILQGKENEINNNKYKFNTILRNKEKEITAQKEGLNNQKKSYERYVDFKNVEVNNTRLGAHFIKNVMNQIHTDLEDIEQGYKTFLGIEYRKVKDKKKIPSVKALKNIYKLLDYNVSALNKTEISIEEELKHVHMFLELIQYLKPNTKINFNNSLNKQQHCTMKIKPTLFFPFLENALKHGCLNEKNSFIDIDLKENRQNELSYCLLNSAEHFSINNQNEKSGKFGLNALKDLLDVYYPGSKMECKSISNSKYLSQLILIIK